MLIENLLNPLILVTFLPMVGFLLILFLKGERKDAIRWVALIASLATFGISIWILFLFNPTVDTPQMKLTYPWLNVGGFKVNFSLKVDGLNILLLLLTTLLTPISILSTWRSITEKVKGFMLFFLLLESGMIGVFLAMDLVLFYLFWEITLIPMYFLIGIWGSERKVYAAVKFFLFTMAGSVLMLLAILFLGWRTGTFELDYLIANRAYFADAQTWLFFAFAIAFAIKVPMFPLHSWLPDAHTEAPTAGSVILAGVLLKMGTYGFLRFNLQLFPVASVQYAPLIGILAVIGILYGALVAFAQKDVKRLVAYSSISHLGFVMLGIFALNPEGLTGGLLQMINHGLSTGALFLIVGMLYERRHTREMAQFGGLWKVVPMLGGLMLVITLSSLALPGLNGFVGEFAILLGAFGSSDLGSPFIGGFATLGVVLAAVYLLTMFQKVFLGPVVHEENQSLKDLDNRETLLLLPILLLIFWIGLYPKFFIDLIEPAVTRVLITLLTY